MELSLLLTGILSAGYGGGIPVGPVCAMARGPDYYAIELVATRRIPGTGSAQGRAEVSRVSSSPFAISLTPEGSYAYDLHVAVQRMRTPRQGVLVAWVTTSDLDRVGRIGRLDENLEVSGAVSWNKFIVLITLESDDEPNAQRWSGPVVFRGMSRSGMMHTMAGHGALQQENCAAYGYDE